MSNEDPLSQSASVSQEHTSPAGRAHTNGSNIQKSNTHLSHKETHRDPDLDVSLPYRTLTENANFNEYTTEKREGEIAAGLGPDGKQQYELVTFLPNDPENPKNWSKAYKWYCTMVVATTCFVVALASSVITADIAGVEKEFDVSEELALASVSLFVVGFGTGKHFPVQEMSEFALTIQDQCCSHP